MTDAVSDLKQRLRQQCRETRRALGEQARMQASAAICAHIETWRFFQRSSVLLTYLPMRGEVDLTPLLLRHPGKRWLAPRILPEENHRMALHVYDPQRLVRHKFGMLEPAADLPEVLPTEVQMVLTPGLAYDRRGWRLGYGGGYFDRFLQDFEGVSLGVVYAALLLDELPHGTFDVPMDWIATEQGLLACHAEAK
ncbi:MAG: 5-formyltetrahydrofolate cyclo-ligase [Chloroflexota bacterium]